MKKLLILFFMISFFIPLFAQDYYAIPKPGSNYVNPKIGSNSPFFRINSITRKTPISPFAKNDIYEIVYSIYDDTNKLVYRESITNRFENALDLFFTEDSVFEMRVPEFSWNGRTYDKDYEKTNKETAPDGREYKYVQDGKYELIVTMNTDTIQIDQFKTLQEYTIIVDTTPLDFTLRTIVSREDSLDQSSFSLYANEFAKEWVVMVDDITIKTITPQSEEMLTLSLPVQTFSGEEFAGEHMIRVKATDLANNVSFQECQLVITPYTAGGGSFTPPQGNLPAGESPPNGPFEPLPNPTGENPLGQTPPIVPVPPLLIKIEGGRRYLDIPDIAFLPYKTGYFEPENSLKNAEYLKTLAASIISEIDEGKIEYLNIDGYAYPTKLFSTQKAVQEEHDEVLKPLSLARAEDIKDLLALLGVPVEKIKVRGLGGSYAIENPRVEANKSRRVRLWIE